MLRCPEACSAEAFRSAMRAGVLGATVVKAVGAESLRLHGVDSEVDNLEKAIHACMHVCMCLCMYIYAVCF